MSPILLHFLATLATSPDLMGRYLKDPETTMALFGLSAEDTALVLRRDAGQLEAVVRQAATQVVYVPYPAYGYPQSYYPAPMPFAAGMSAAPAMAAAVGSPQAASGPFMVPGPVTHFFREAVAFPDARMQASVAPVPAVGQAVARAEFGAVGPRPIPGPATHILR